MSILTADQIDYLEKIPFLPYDMREEIKKTRKKLGPVDYNLLIEMTEDQS